MDCLLKKGCKGIKNRGKDYKSGQRLQIGAEQTTKTNSFCNASKSILPLKHLSNSLERVNFDGGTISFRLKDFLAFVFYQKLLF